MSFLLEKEGLQFVNFLVNVRHIGQIEVGYGKPLCRDSKCLRKTRFFDFMATSFISALNTSTCLGASSA